jgi:hypothetical protein
MLATEPLKLKEEKPPLLKGKCPICKKVKLVTVMTFDGRGPPQCWKELPTFTDQPWELLADRGAEALCLKVNAKPKRDRTVRQTGAKVGSGSLEKC